MEQLICLLINLPMSHYILWFMYHHIYIYEKIASLFAWKKFRKKVTNINLNILKYLGKTSLHYASEKGHLSVVELLLNRSSDIDQKDRLGEFILSIYIYMYLSYN